MNIATSREAAEAFNPGNWGWGRRRRSLAITNLRADSPKTIAEKTVAQKRAVITVTRAQASSLLAMSKGISKRGSICLRYVEFSSLALVSFIVIAKKK